MEGSPRVHEDEQAEPDGEDLDAVALRNVSEVVYPGRDPVVVRTTYLPSGSDPERRVRAGMRRLAREGRFERGLS
jgi:hypothetical protein